MVLYRKTADGRKIVMKRRPVSNSTKRYVKGAISRRMEKKRVDVTDLGSSSNTIIIDELAGDNIAQNTTGTDGRVGDKINLESFDFWIRTYIPETSVPITQDNVNVIRVILFQWKESTTPIGGDILQDPNTFLSQLNYLTRDRYKILKDFNMIMTFNGPNDALKKISISKNKMLKSINYYNAGNSDYGRIFVLLVSDSLGAPHPVYEYYSRVLYSDP